MNKTKIEWVKNPDGSQGYTWNPITGCLNGCEYCYARKLADGRLKSLYLSNACYQVYGRRDKYEVMNDPFYPRFWPERITELKSIIAGKRSKPRGIFVVDMGEWMAPWVPAEWTQNIIDCIRLNPQHRFYTLTHQPQELIKWSPFPDNCWVGVTATNTRMALAACLKLGDIEASIRYLSIEPMLNSINLPPEHLKVCNINQVIIGAQTKPYKPPRIEWVEEIVRACDKAGVPVFLKDNLKPLLNTLDITGTSFGRLTSLDESINRQGYRKREWYPLRQEMPDGQ